MVYSFQPVFDNTNDHTGFYFMLSLIAIIAVCMYFFERETDDFDGLMFVMILGAIVLAITGYNSWHPGPPPINEKVTGKFEGYVAESESRKSGKNSTTTDHYVYARFRIADGHILIKVNPQTPIPDNVILYRNND